MRAREATITTKAFCHKEDESAATVPRRMLVRLLGVKLLDFALKLGGKNALPRSWESAKMHQGHAANGSSSTRNIRAGGVLGSSF